VSRSAFLLRRVDDGLGQAALFISARQHTLPPSSMDPYVERPAV
jgi:hypothetical protein